MFLKTTQFKKMLRELYTGTGIEVFNTGEEIRIGGGYWMVNVKNGKINKENLAAVIEFTGNLPEPERGFCAGKDRENQESFALRTYQTQDIKDELYISRILFRYGDDKNLRLLQDDDRNIYLIREEVLKLIDLSKLEPAETTPNGPFLMLDKFIEWKNDTMTLRVIPTKSNDFSEVLKALRDIPGGIV